MEERIKALEGITYVEWKKLKNIIDNKFYDISKENTFIASKDVLDDIKTLFR